ncbi:hypothetical protein ACFE04_030508 [Oxalis oulophora]
MDIYRRGSFDEGDADYDEVERPVAYGRLLKTWAKWVDKNIDPNRTTVFFSSMSPHLFILNRRLFAIAANVTQSMKIPTHFLNISTLSEYRKDAHTSVYTIRQGKMLTAEQQADPNTYADCIHWCLPGLPDTWNEFIYTNIISRRDD